MAQTNYDIPEELERLRALANDPPLDEDFNDSEPAILAQITVIEEQLMFSATHERFSEEEDYILDAALAACRWLWEDDDAPSKAWAELACEA